VAGRPARKATVKPPHRASRPTAHRVRYLLPGDGAASRAAADGRDAGFTTAAPGAVSGGPRPLASFVQVVLALPGEAFAEVAATLLGLRDLNLLGEVELVTAPASCHKARQRSSAGPIVLFWNRMRIDAKATIGGYPALVVRKTLRYVRMWDQWGLADLEAAAGLARGTGPALVQALHDAGLIEASGPSSWTVTQAGRTLSSATAAKAITRPTAEKALAQFLERVTQVNEDPYFLARATRVVLFGSLLKPDVERLSDVDLAVELTNKESDFQLAQAQNQQRAEELANRGRRFRNILEWEACGYLEALQYLKGRSRVIALADYKAEKTFVLAVPHRFLIGEPEPIAAPTTPPPAPRQRRPRRCPF
jgi:predicted nucleotidyltransferase